MPPNETLACIGLGASLGDRAAALAGALAALRAADGVRVVAVSRVYETPPAGGVATRPFLNAAVAVMTTLAPREVLGLLNGIEAAAGRIRKERWADRTLDLDILLYGDRIIQEPGLAIPHPRLAERRFVLAPLADIAPDTVVPGTGMTVARLLAECVDTAKARVVEAEGWA